MISESRWAAIVRVERWALWLALPSLAALVIAIVAKAPSSVFMWVFPIALASGSLWLGINHGLRPLVTGKARLSFIVHSTRIPDPLARFVGLVYLVMSAIGLFFGLLFLFIGH